MATKTLASLYPRVLIECSGVPDFIMLDMIRDSAIVLFRRSSVWRKDLDLITTATNIKEYELSVETDENISSILDAEHNDSEIFGKSVKWLNNNLKNWRTNTAKQIKYYNRLTSKTVLVSPIPNEVKAQSLMFRVAIAPSLDATTIAEDMYDDWYEVIVAGAKARLMRIPNKEWTNLNRADYYGNLYSNGINAAKMRANKDNTTESLTVKPVAFI